MAGRRETGRTKAAAPAGSADSPSVPKPRRSPKRCNDLPGKRWLLNSLSVWSDIAKSPEEKRLQHPAMFPSMLAERLIESFLPAGPHLVVDPFAGSGSTLVAAERLGKIGLGLEISPEYVAIASRRLAQPLPSTASVSRTIQRLRQPPLRPLESGGRARLHQASAVDLLEYVSPGTIDLCVTSPPYWNILNQRRTADLKTVRHYGNLQDDLGTIADYDEFLSALAGIFATVRIALKPGAHCAIVVMDLRKKDRFYPFHSDLAARLQTIGYCIDDLIVWNRQTEYNNLRPLGYPAVFRVNKVHEFILLMQKPK